MPEFTASGFRTSSSNMGRKPCYATWSDFRRRRSLNRRFNSCVAKKHTKSKPSLLVNLPQKPRYVSRGGDKLRGALDTFGISVQGKVCLDVGSSTGGFTDCLLQAGAKQVWAVD